METKVVYKCTVYGSDGVELFQLESNDMAVVADEAARKARADYPLQGLAWQIEKIYPISAAAQFQPPNMDARLEAYAEDVLTIVNASNQV